LCVDNLKGAYVLIHDLGHTAEGRRMLSKEMNLCTPLTTNSDITQLLQYLQSPLFDLSEGSYPFPSDYITFALTGSNDPLPAWAMREHCRSLDRDYGLVYEGNVSDVLFTLKLDHGVEVYVNWEATSNNNYTMEMMKQAKGFELVNDVANAIQIWYNVSGSMPSCIDWNPASSTVSNISPIRSLSKHPMRSVGVKHASNKLSSASVTSTCSLADDQFDAGEACYSYAVYFVRLLVQESSRPLLRYLFRHCLECIGLQ